MIVCVHDANILIDLAKSGLLDAYARLGWKTHVPDMVLREVREEIGIWLERGLFQIESFQAEELTKSFCCSRPTPDAFLSLTPRPCTLPGDFPFPF